MTATVEHHLACGTLALRVDEAELPLEALCGFASRRNRKRGFLIVSKVLGKHIPVRPSVMEDVHRRLAGKLEGVEGPAVLIAMAETATALGQGVFEQWLHQSGRTDMLFLHTTRYRLSRPLALRFDESHSHATEHKLYDPADPDDRALFRSARSLVLVDDEISTGRTLVNLARAYRDLNPSLKALHLVSITDWLSPERRADIEGEVGVPVGFPHLLRGQFRFTPDASFDPGPIPDVIGRGDLKDEYLPEHGGRHGLRHPIDVELSSLLPGVGFRRGERVLVLGSGEFAYLPFRLARRLEAVGVDVQYQSTTRSPVLVGGDIGSVLEFADNYHDDIPNFVYNVAERRYDCTVIGYETRPLPPGHALPEMLGARVVYF